MKRSTWMLLAALVTPMAGPAAELASSFTWQMPLEGTFKPASLYRVKVPGAVFDGCRRFPQDVRIIDDRGEQWPFYLWKPQDTRSFKTRSVKVLNRSLVEGDDPYLRIELQVVGPRAVHNRIIINSDGQNFIRRVEVLGSVDRKAWGQLTEGYLIDHATPQRVRNSEVRYPDADFPYLELRIHRNARRADETFGVKKVSVGRFIGREAERVDVPLERLPAAAEPEPPDSYRSVYLDTGFAGQPVERLHLVIADPEFARPVQVMGRNGPADAWVHVFNGEVHRLGESVRLTLQLDSTYRMLKLEVFHYDDAPLTIEQVTAEAVPRYLVFEPSSAGPATLYAGSESVQAPRYDLQRRTDAPAAATAPLASLGTRAPNQAFTRDRADTYLPWIAGGVIALLSLVILWVIAGMLKRGGELNT
jgi:hypothetical protein